MTLESKLAALFRLDGENWMRHANPASVWTRYTVLPAIVMSLWSRAWIGWWCLVPTAASLTWMFINPVLFAKPASTKNWASRAVLGERVYMNRNAVPIPESYRTPLIGILNMVSLAGLVLAVWGAVDYSVWNAATGIALAYLGKSWFLDRMVRLYEDMKGENEEYGRWDY